MNAAANGAKTGADGNTKNMNSAYVEYARYHGRTADEQLGADGGNFIKYATWRWNWRERETLLNARVVTDDDCSTYDEGDRFESSSVSEQ